MTKKRKKGPTPKCSEVQPLARRRLPGGALLRALILSGLVAAFAVGLALFRDGGGDRGGLVGLPTSDPGPVHVNGLGINPSDGALFIATHTGLWRVGKGSKPRREGYRPQARHDGLRRRRPGSLPRIRTPGPSRRAAAAARTHRISGRWQDVGRDLGARRSRLHVLRSRGKRVYGFDSSWRVVGQQIGLLAWPSRTQLYIVDQVGGVGTSADGGVTWRSVGDIGGQPGALMARGRQELYVALHDGTVKRSIDGGRTWTIRASPA